MKLKIKKTVGNSRAILYRRLSSTDTIYRKTGVVYKTIPIYNPYNQNIKSRYYIFNSQKCEFEEIEEQNGDFIEVKQDATKQYFEFFIIKNDPVYFSFNFGFVDGVPIGWEKTTKKPTDGYIKGVTRANIGNAHRNVYLYGRTFSYVVRGNENLTTESLVQGIVAPTKDFTIVTYDDIDMKPDDLVIVEGRAYLVENPQVVPKRLPKKFNIYTATLNSIL